MHVVTFTLILMSPFLCAGTWSSPEVSGDCPPPCVDFSFNCIDDRLTVLFGGYQPESGASSGAYILDMELWVSCHRLVFFIGGCSARSSSQSQYIFRLIQALFCLINISLCPILASLRNFIRKYVQTFLVACYDWDGTCILEWLHVACGVQARRFGFMPSEEQNRA